MFILYHSIRASLRVGYFGSLTILAKRKLNHLIGWLRRPIRWTFQSDGAAIGLSVLQKLSRSRYFFPIPLFFYFGDYNLMHKPNRIITQNVIIFS